MRVPGRFVSLISVGELQQLVSTHGYWVVGLIVGLESLGLPLPGETILVLAAIYAATEPSFDIWVVIAVAAFGAIIGDNAGYWLGSRYGYALLLRYGERIGMFERRIKLGQYLFLRHGAKVVFLGRFVASAARLTLGRGTFHFEISVMRFSDKNLPKNGSAHRWGSLFVFREKISGAGQDSAVGASASAGQRAASEPKVP